jgi:hypothetical protein
MTDAISLVLASGLSPLVALIVIMIAAGLAYKFAGRTAAVIAILFTTFAMAFMDFLPVYWAIGTVLGLIAFLVVIRNGN